MEGHAPGALNVPLQRAKGDRLVDNPEFLLVMSALFRTTDPLLIACRTGARSSIAVTRLEQLGFVRLSQLRHGFLGARDAFGRRLPGWVQAGFAIEHGEGGSYASLLERVRVAGQG